MSLGIYVQCSNKISLNLIFENYHLILYYYNIDSINAYFNNKIGNVNARATFIFEKYPYCKENIISLIDAHLLLSSNKQYYKYTPFIYYNYLNGEYTCINGFEIYYITETCEHKILRVYSSLTMKLPELPATTERHHFNNNSAHYSRYLFRENIKPLYHLKRMCVVHDNILYEYAREPYYNINQISKRPKCVVYDVKWQNTESKPFNDFQCEIYHTEVNVKKIIIKDLEINSSQSSHGSQSSHVYIYKYHNTKYIINGGSVNSHFNLLKYIFYFNLNESYPFKKFKIRNNTPVILLGIRFFSKDNKDVFIEFVISKVVQKKYEYEYNIIEEYCVTDIVDVSKFIPDFNFKKLMNDLILDKIYYHLDGNNVYEILCKEKSDTHVKIKISKMLVLEFDRDVFISLLHNKNLVYNIFL